MDADRPAGRSIHDTAELAELATARRRFVVPALAFFAVVYGAFLICVGYAQSFMAKPAVGAFSWAYVWALALIALTWAITWSYLHYSERVLAPLAERARTADGAGAGHGRR